LAPSDDSATDEFADFMNRLSSATPPPAAPTRAQPKEPRTVAEEEQSQGERDKIRSFWDKIRSGTVTPGENPA